VKYAEVTPTNMIVCSNLVLSSLLGAKVKYKCKAEEVNSLGNGSKCGCYNNYRYNPKLPDGSSVSVQCSDSVVPVTVLQEMLNWKWMMPCTGSK